MTGENIIGINAVSMNVLSRRSDSVRLSLSWLRTAFSRFVMAVMVSLALPFFSRAATVPFEVAFTHSGTTPSKRPLSHIFVLDRSGSMYNSRDAECERNGKMVQCNRWEALKDSLRKTLANTPDKTELRFIIVDGDRREKGFLLFEKDGVKSDNGFFSWGSGGKEMTDTIIMGEKYREPSEISAIIKRLGEPGGNTPLYDTLQYVMLRAWDLFKEGKRVSVFVFSDGENVGGKIRSEDELKRSLIRNQVPEDMVNNLSFLPIWVSKTKPGKKLFDTDWLEPGTVPMVATVESSPITGLVLDNPVSGKIVPIKLGFDFKVSDEIWSKIQKYTDELIVCTGEGRRVASYPIKFKDKEVFAINIDNKSLSPARDNVFQVQLKCDFPKGSYITCDKPDPIRLTFAKAGEVSVAIVSPRPSQVVKCGEQGEVVKFEAMVKPETAECEWDFGDNSPVAHGVQVEHRYLKSDTFAYSVRAKVKDNSLIPGTAKGSISATNASVSLLLPTQKVSVGDETVLKAVGEGPIVRYEWSIAGVRMEGSESELRWKPDASGKTAVSVRAIMKGEMKSESDSKILLVEAKPYVGIVSPKPGFEAEIGTPLPMVARVVNVDSVNFNVYGDGHKLVATQLGSAVKDNVSEAMLNLKGAGSYQIEVVSGDGAVKGAPVDISIKAEQLKVFIDSPKNGEPCKTSEHKNIVAHVRGSKVLLDECGGLVWEVNGVPIPNGSGKINDKGEMSAVWTIPDELARKECVLRAYALDKEGAKTLACDEVTIEPLIEGSIDIVQPSNDKHVHYDEAFDLEARTSGRVKGVSWFVEGEPVPIGSGKKHEYRVKHTGQKKAVIRLHAEAEMPAGESLKSDEVVVTAFCPDIQAEIQQPATNNIGRTKEYTVNIIGSNADRLESETIVWDMGDGTIYTNKGISVTHKYTDYGTYTIKASGYCAKCREPVCLKAPASVVVERQSAVAKFNVNPSKSAYPVRGGVTLQDQSTGDISKRVWRVLRSNGDEIFKHECVEKMDVDYQFGKGKEELRPDDLTVILEVTDGDGKVARPYSVSLRLRYGWWAIVIFFIVAIIVVVLSKQVLLGNEVLDLTVTAHIGMAPNGDLKDLLDAIDNPQNTSLALKDLVRPIDKFKMLFKKEKRLVVSVPDILDGKDEDGCRFGGKSFTFYMADGVPRLVYDEQFFGAATPRPWQTKSPMEQGDNEPNTRIVVLLDKKCKDAGVSCLYVLMRPGPARVKSLLSFWIVVGMVLYLVFKCSVTYAI